MVAEPTDDREYELFVREVAAALSIAKNHDDVEVVHDVKIAGNSGHRHQVDVLWTYREADRLHHVVVECRHFRSTLSVKHVLELIGRIQDLPGHRGMLATREGYQAGALKLAKEHDIELRVIRAPREQDYAGRMRVIELHLVTSQVKPLGVTVVFDENWIKKEPEEIRESVRSREPVDLYKTFLEDRDRLTRRSIADLIQALPITNGDACRRLVWKDGYMDYGDGRPLLKVAAIVFTYHNVETEDVHRIGGEPDDALVADPLRGTSLFMGGDSTFSGDTSDE